MSQNDQETKKVGRYETVSATVRSYFGALYEGKIVEGDGAGKPVAMRLLEATDLSWAELDRIAEVSRAMVDLEHDHLVPIRDVVRDDGLCVVSDPVSGESLRDLMRLMSVRRSPVPIGVLVRIGLDMLDAV